MGKYDFFISYSRQDHPIAEQLYQALLKAGHSCFLDIHCIAPDSDYRTALADAIQESDTVLILISESTLQSHYVYAETAFAIERSSSRAKTIIPVRIGEVSSVPPKWEMMLSLTQWIKPDLSDPDWAERLANRLVTRKSRIKAKADQYELYSEFVRNHLYHDACGVLTVIGLLLTEIIEWHKAPEDQYSLFMELDRCFESFRNFSVHSEEPVTEQSAEAGQRMLELLSIVSEKAGSLSQSRTDPYSVCWMLRFWYRCATLPMACQALGAAIPEGFPTAAECLEKQRPCQEIYLKSGFSAPPAGKSEEYQFFRDTGKYILHEEPIQIEAEGSVKPSGVRIPASRNDRLEAIARYIREGNRIFEIISQDERATAFIRCLITSYERLRNYCQEIGASDLTAECIRRIADLKERLQKQEESEDEEHSTAEKGIRALLGFTRPGTGNYDAFLSHRGYDKDIADRVYQFLKARMKEVFYDTVSLAEELSDTDYKNAIYQALDKSKHFIVIITDLSELASGYQKHDKDWMQIEMDVFHSELIEGRKKDGNFVILVTDEVYRQTVDANKANIDLKWRNHSLIKISEFQNQIMGYLK